MYCIRMLQSLAIGDKRKHLRKKRNRSSFNTTNFEASQKRNEQAPTENGSKQAPKAPADECGGCPAPLQCLPNTRTGCTDDSECSDGDICAGGICRGKGSCKGRGDCKSDELCINGICKTKSLCSVDADCRSGHHVSGQMRASRP